MFTLFRILNPIVQNNLIRHTFSICTIVLCLAVAIYFFNSSRLTRKMRTKLGFLLLAIAFADSITMSDKPIFDIFAVPIFAFVIWYLCHKQHQSSKYERYVDYQLTHDANLQKAIIKLSDEGKSSLTKDELDDLIKKVKRNEKSSK